MVLGVARRVLGNLHDAEDAFQATFLVLARKAAVVRPRDMVANWLYGVACRTALKARTMSERRRAREKQVLTMPEPEIATRDPGCDLEPLIDQELARLPDKYRTAIVFCDLEGKTRKEAARQLKIPEGTLSSRLALGASRSAISAWQPSSLGVTDGRDGHGRRHPQHVAPRRVHGLTTRSPSISVTVPVAPSSRSPLINATPIGSPGRSG